MSSVLHTFVMTKENLYAITAVIAYMFSLVMFYLVITLLMLLFWIKYNI